MSEIERMVRVLVEMAFIVALSACWFKMYAIEVEIKQLKEQLNYIENGQVRIYPEDGLFEDGK